MGTPFKMKGFSGFKESPVKGKGDNLKRIMTENKDAMKKTGTWYKSKSADPKYKGKGNFNFTGSSASTTPKYKGKGNFNFTGSKASKTPGFSTTKIGKTLGKAGKLLGGKLAGTLGLLGAGTLSATATPTGEQGKKGSYTDDFTKLK
jgi:hypothetical protein